MAVRSNTDMIGNVADISEADFLVVHGSIKIVAGKECQMTDNQREIRIRNLPLHMQPGLRTPAMPLTPPTPISPNLDHTDDSPSYSRPSILLINTLRPHTLHHLLRLARRQTPLLRDQFLQQEHHILRHARVAAAVEMRPVALEEGVDFFGVGGEVVLHVVLFGVGAGEGGDEGEVGAEGCLGVLLGGGRGC